MKSYLHLIAAVGVLIPFAAGAQMSSPPYSLPFRMSPVACPSPSAQKKWSFTQLTASKDTGRCKAYFAAGGEGFAVNNWQSSTYLNPWDLAQYTVGAGIAACQKAACTLHVGGGASNNATGIAAARAALAMRNTPSAAAPVATPGAPAVGAIMPCVK